MNTIKFQTWSEQYLLFKGTDAEKRAKSTSLLEGGYIWHRPFQMKTNEEYEEWKEDFHFGKVETKSHLPGEDPSCALAEMKKDKDHGNIHFEYLTFIDSEEEFNRVVIFCCNCFIMNAEGQTVDSFAT